MNLFITSSPYIENAPRALLSNNNGFIDRIREVLPENPNVLFVASNPDDHYMTCQFAAETTAAFCEAGIPFSSYHVLDWTTVRRAYQLISASDLILLSGGHVPTQNAFFRKIRLRHLLRHFEGCVVGISAGSMNCADLVYVQPEEEGESVPSFQRFAPGLGLTEVNLLPHYQKVKDNILDGLRLFEDITYADSMGHCFFALPDNSYFYQDDDGLLLFGEGYRLCDGILEQICENDQCLNLAELE
ncbi:MAG: Type 1 glutamine amidotransferase-like domain-containing protein [Faecousia sp.]